jgi:nucleoside-diphosphate-sugar epimerase
MNILITGAGGFIGRNLKEYLSPNYKIFATTHDDLELLDEKAVEEYVNDYTIDVIVHCAAIGGSRKANYDPGSTDVVEKNLRMFFNLERCLTPNMRMIHLGSGAEYDRHQWRRKMPETFFDRHVPSDCYGYAKYLISKYIGFRDNIVCLRLFGVFGKYEEYHFKFISNAVVKNLLHMPITINQNVVFDYLYIDDLVKIVELFIRQIPIYNYYNITPTLSIDLITIAEIINTISDYKSDIIVLHEGLNSEYSGDNSRLLAEYSSISFKEYQVAIEELLFYYRSILTTIDKATIRSDPYLHNCYASTTRIERNSNDITTK